MSAAGIGYTAGLVVAAVFAAAAVAKLRDPDATIRSFTDLGVPNPQATARLVPLPELAVAALLVVVPPLGGLAALVLLAFFTTFVVRTRRAGVRAPCACFGAVGRAPLGWATVLRNGLLALGAAGALATSRPVPPTPAELAAVGVATAAAAGLVALGSRLDRPTRSAGTTSLRG
jgi:uncharacterized membrane protein YphA (DoxX/SURF4 family)